ncbi:MAG: hypothetical protein K2X39_07065 [Silvanigrellaceae bacterium]|nr:hypothetical protein [Silvanigrellaceae bacterium]
MYEDKGMTAALIAAVEVFKRIPEYSCLERYRRKAIKKSLKMNSKIKSCYCDETETVHHLKLIRPVEMENQDKIEFKTLPFAYAIYLFQSKIMPYLEIIEFPIFSSHEHFTHTNFDEINEKISPSYKIFTLLSTKKSGLIDLNRIRIQIFRQIYDQNGSPGHIIFTHFRNLHETMVKNELRSYVAALNLANTEIPWEFNRARFLPIEVCSELKVVPMTSWTLTASDLGR